MLLTEILYSCRYAASLLYYFCSRIVASRMFLHFTWLVGSWWWFGSPIVRQNVCSFINSLVCWYCLRLLWYLDRLLFRAHRRCLSVSSEVNLVCSLKIWYFVFIEFVILFIFVEGLGSFICDILLVLAQRSFIGQFKLNVQSLFPLLMYCFLIIHSFSVHTFNHGDCFSISKLIQTCDVSFLC